MQITGSNGIVAKVTSAFRLAVDAVCGSRAHAAAIEGQAFSALFVGAGAANDQVAYLKNTSNDKNIVIDKVLAGAANNVLFKLARVTGTAASGAAVTPSNLLLGSGVSAEASAMNGDTAITGLTVAATLAHFRALANATLAEDQAGSIVLPPGQAVAIEYDTGTAGNYDIQIIFHQEAID